MLIQKDIVDDSREYYVDEQEIHKEQLRVKDTELNQLKNVCNQMSSFNYIVFFKKLHEMYTLYYSEEIHTEQEQEEEEENNKQAYLP